MRGTPSENSAILGAINPQSSATAKSTGWIHAGAYEFLRFIGILGATDQDINAKVERATDDQGNGAEDVTGKAIVQIGNATADNKQFCIDVHRDNDLEDGKPYVRLTITPSSGTGTLMAALVEGFNARFRPVSHAASVAQVITGAGLTDPA